MIQSVYCMCLDVIDPSNSFQSISHRCVLSTHPLLFHSFRSPTKVRYTWDVFFLFFLPSSSLANTTETGLPCPFSRDLRQTTCLQHRLQPNLRTPFPHCSLLPGRTLLVLLLRSQPKSKCLFPVTSLCSHATPCCNNIFLNVCLYMVLQRLKEQHKRVNFVAVDNVLGLLGDLFTSNTLVYDQMNQADWGG